MMSRWIAGVVGAMAMATTVTGTSLGHRGTGLDLWRSQNLDRTLSFPQVETRPRVLVLPFAVQIDPSSAQKAAEAAWLGEAAAILVADELANAGLPVFSREERVAAFDRLQLPMSSGLTRAMTIRAGELSGASHLVLGEVRVGDRLHARARLIDLEHARELADRSGEGTAAGMHELFARLADELAAAHGGPPVAPAPTAPRLPLDVFENYVKGLIAVTPAVQQRFLEMAFHRAPRDANVLIALWSVYAEQGQHAKALAAARSVPADSPLLSRAQFAASVSLIELARWNEAYKSLSDLHAERPAPALANALGIVQLRRAEGGQAPLVDTPPAAAFFRRAVESAPEDTDYLFNLGYASALANDSAAALLWLREAVRFDAADGDAHLVMSAVLAASGRNVEAQRELDLARLLGTREEVPAGPPRVRVPSGLERLRTDLDVWGVRPALSIANPTQREQQAVADFHLEEGRKRLEEGRDRDAIEALRRAIYLSPYRDEPHLLLGRLYQRGGRLQEAIDEFKVAIWCRETVDARVALGTALVASGDRAAARAEADRALVLAPNSAEAQALRRSIE